jgi:hypothetical protein
VEGVEGVEVSTRVRALGVRVDVGGPVGSGWDFGKKANGRVDG